MLIPDDKVKFHPPTGLSVLIVGAGVAGLMSALECRRKGHDVRVIERVPSPSTEGRPSFSPADVELYMSISNRN